MNLSLVRRGFSVFVLIGVGFGGFAEASAPTGRYTVSAGTVYDTKTKLTWQQTTPSTPYAPAMGVAAAYCGSLGTNLGGSGWRLPTVKELLTIVDYSQLASGMVMVPGVAMDPLFRFQGTGAPPLSYWSSTAVAGSLTAGWTVNFQSGLLQIYPANQNYAVRCVH